MTEHILLFLVEISMAEFMSNCHDNINEEMCFIWLFFIFFNDDQAMGTHITLLKATDRSCPREQFPSQ